MPIRHGKYRHTKFCVFCLKEKAVSWCGHVLRDKEHLLAGWCEKCEHIEAGFVGHYKKKMKTIEDETL